MLIRKTGIRRQQGMSLVELMVGIAVGMFVVAATTMLASSQLVNNRRLITETQLQQDLRATADIISRDIRRAGGSGVKAIDPTVLIWSPSNEALANSEAPLLTLLADKVEFKVQRTSGEAGPYGYRLNGTSIQSELSEDSWQTLTDANVIKVTAFNIAAADLQPVVIPCPKKCPDGTEACWPTVTVRSLVVDITAEATNDPSVVRSVRSVSRLQNDFVQFNNAPSTSACPA